MPDIFCSTSPVHRHYWYFLDLEAPFAGCSCWHHQLLVHVRVGVYIVQLRENVSVGITLLHCFFCSLKEQLFQLLHLEAVTPNSQLWPIHFRVVQSQQLVLDVDVTSARNTAIFLLFICDFWLQYSIYSVKTDKYNFHTLFN